MLWKTCLISHGILPVCTYFGDEGCIKVLACYVRSCSCMTDHLVFSVRQPPPAINPGNLEASEDKLRLFELFLGKAKRPRLVCANPSPKCASLGWEFGSPCSVGGTQYVCLPDVSLSVSPSLVYSFTVIGEGKKNLKESIRRWVFFSDNSWSSSKRYFPAGWRTIDRTALLHSHNMVGLEWSSRAAYCLHFHTWTTWWKLSCLKQIVLVTWHKSHHVQFETALHLHKGKHLEAYRGAKLTNHHAGQSLGQSRHSRLHLRRTPLKSLLPPIALFQRIAPSGSQS